MSMSPLPAVDGVVTGADILATGRFLAALQAPSGAISWPDGHVNAWDQVECAMALSVCGLAREARRAYEWLGRAQRADGSWPRRTEGETVTDPAGETNQATYVAVGVWHEVLLTGDRAFAQRMWPVVRDAMEFALALQAPRGEIGWERDAHGVPATAALLTGCSSSYQSLRCAVSLADYLGEPQPGWELAAGQLRHVIVSHPEAFLDKSRFSMDWYYPVLAGPVRGPAATDRLAERWAEFVVPGLGVRCVRDQPWVTGAETCELVMALDAAGDDARARRVFADVQHLRDAAGGYWTGWQFEDRSNFPAEQSGWTAAAVILAADALSRATPGSGLFRDAGAPAVPTSPSDASACGCAAIPAG